MSEPLRLLEADGSLAEGARAPGIDSEALTRLYEILARSRALDEALAARRARGEIARHHGLAGEESVSLGAALALSPDDWLLAGPADSAALLHRGATVSACVRLVRETPGYGEEPGYWRGRRCVPFHGQGAARIPQAAGLAWAGRLRGEGSVALVSFGEATASHPEFHVGVNLAGVLRAPLVLLCRTRRGPALDGLPPQGAVEVASRAVAYGVEAIRVEGWDLLAVRQAVREAVAGARAGAGATLVDAVTWREDGRTPVRPERDPVVLFRRHLEGKGLWNARREEELWRAVRDEIDGAIGAAAAGAELPAEALLDGVYESPPLHLREQRRESRPHVPGGEG